jgi:hypothetical protein
VPVISSYLEAEIRRITVPVWAKKFAKTLSTEKRPSMMVCACHSSDGRKLKIGSWSRLAWAKCKTLSPISPEQKGWEVWLKW